MKFLVKEISLFTTLFLVLGNFVQAQDTTYLSFEEYFNYLKNNNPIVLAANLNPELAQAKLQKARGSFDPKINANLKAKEYDEKEYYNLQNYELKIPTWLGLDINAAYQNNSGQFLNPENNLPQNGLFNLGASLPIGRGLLTDYRRTQIRMAQVGLKLADAERRQEINALLFEASDAFWNWKQAYEILKLRKEALDLALERYQGIISGFENGYKPAIDTVEASIQVQNRKIDLTQAELDYANTQLIVELYLWSNDFLPLKLKENTYPISNTELNNISVESILNQNIDSLINTHPDVLNYTFTLDQLELERKLRAQELMPNLQLKYNFLGEQFNGDLIQRPLENNFVYGVTFSTPLFLRKERGALNEIKTKTQQMEYKRMNQTAKQRANILAYQNAWQNYQQQIIQSENVVADYKRLVAGEKVKFKNGESSLFLVNKREVSYIAASTKLIELQYKSKFVRLALLYYLGIIEQFPEI